MTILCLSIAGNMRRYSCDWCDAEPVLIHRNDLFRVAAYKRDHAGCRPSGGAA